MTQNKLLMKTILIVEDDLEIRQSMQEILEEEGYTVLSAKNGSEGLQILNDTSPLPGLVFLDLMMPVLDGYSFRKSQLLNPKFALVPTVPLAKRRLVASAGFQNLISLTPTVQNLRSSCFFDQAQ